MSTVLRKSPKSTPGAYWRLMRFDRPIGILLLLWPTLWALWLAAGGMPSLRNLVIFALGVVVMRAAGCVANDLADRNIDPYVERTRDRPLASGELTVQQAIALLAGLMVLALALVSLTNLLTILLAAAGAVLALSYPLFKRFTHFPQVVLGMAFGWSVPMAFAAETGSVPAVAWFLFAINVVWSVIYDTQYAMVDREDDRRIGVRSTALFFGTRDRLVIGVLQFLMLLGLAFLGLEQGFRELWLCALALVSLLFFHQQWLIRHRTREGCFRAFLGNNWVGLVIFAGILAETMTGFPVP